ncbi:Polyketide synthase [Streptomyces graminofaciens]|uniref:Polyketide synthase n=1 Tax=Streptomyces graminofaciens TaxID=68212 RepID=A0ABM7F0L7_9ACTN|nr:Polyketide synthase [Streptomyces graminofaciens]
MGNEDKLRDYLKRVTADLQETRRRLAEAESGTPEPIAIVGMACRFPGGITTPEDLWRHLTSGAGVLSDFPADRGWDADALYDPDPAAPGKSYVRTGGFLHDAAYFDAEFFGIAPRMAVAMDPQHRLVLETAWEALERAGVTAESRGSDTGVFLGASYQDYLSRVAEAPADLEGYLMTGSTASVASGRVSYALGLEGPAVTVDTACSSSLVALHLASQSLRQGECSMALAGGVVVMSTPNVFIEFSRQRGLAPDGLCKAFADGADGTAFSEGVGVLVVERLSDALRSGHRVLAVVRGSAVNQDGASNGLTAPNGPAQQRVIRQALAAARLRPADVDVVEAHGTGTRLGDPIEAEALIETYGQDRERPLLLGSVKSNLGHTQAVAGVAGVMKMVLSLEHGVVPPTLHVAEPTAEVDWSAGAVEVMREEHAWARGERPRRAGVSSFGISGTNAHVILEEAPAPAATPSSAGGPVVAGGVADPGVVPWVISAQSETALRGQAGRLAAHPVENAADTGYSLAASRSVFGHRAVVLGTDRETLLAGARDLAEGRDNPSVIRGTSGTGNSTAGTSGAVLEEPTAFVFAGQGTQRVGMGRELAETYPVFADALREVCAAFEGLLPGPLLPVIFDEPELLDRTEWTQPALFAVEVALARLLEHWGIRPDAVVGHSIGEIAAAHVAGLWSLTDACRVVAARGLLMSELPEGGAMLSVAAPEHEIAPLLPDRAEIAAVNGPTSVVVSGDATAVTETADLCARQGWKTKRLRVGHAFHSAHMDPILEPFRQVLESVKYHEPHTPLTSTATGERVSPADLRSPDHWTRQVRDRVRFQEAIRRLAADGVTRFVGIGPDTTAMAMTQDCLPDPTDAAAGATGDARKAPLAVSLMRPGHPEPTAALTALAELFVRGTTMNWAALFSASGARRVDLPTYSFQRERYWLEASHPRDVTRAGLLGAEHPLLGAVVTDPESGGVTLTGRLSLAEQPWLADHAIAGTTILPAAAFVELVVRAGDEVECGEVEELTLHAPLVLPSSGGAQVQVRVGASDESGRRLVGVYARAESAAADGWTRHASGTLAATASAPEDVEALTQWPPRDAVSLPSVSEVYDDFTGRGYAYGPVFQGLRAAWRRGDEVFAEVALPEGAASEAAEYGLHPALLDAALQSMTFLPDDAFRTATPALPFTLSGVTLRTAGASALRVRVRRTGEDTVTVQVYDPTGAPVASIDALVTRPVPVEQLAAGQGMRDCLFTVEWSPVSADGGVPEKQWTVLADPASGEDTETDVAFVRCPAGPDARTVTATALAWIQAWLDDPVRESARLVFVTRGAVATDSDDAPTCLEQAGVWGLVRSAAREHPGRFALVDLDTDLPADDETWTTLAARVASESELALRDGRALVPRLTRAVAVSEGRGLGDLAGRTVLITGGTGGLGSLVARHVVAAGAGHVLLAGRRGPDAPGVAELTLELAQLGARVSVVACDVGERDAVAELLASVPAEFPLTAVIHTAGVVDDGVVTSLTSGQLDAVFGAKADAAWHLHELTRDMDLSAFVLFSSLSGVMGAAGQANYAAANATLDALAAHRRAQGLPAVSLAWGLWERTSGMTGHLAQTDFARMTRAGVRPLSSEQGLALLDAAVGMAEALVVPARLDAAAARAADGEVPPVLRGLAGGGVRRPLSRATATAAGAAPGDQGLATRLTSLSEADQYELLLDLVRTHLAAVLGHTRSTTLDAGRAFKDLGVDSLTAVELRNRLNTATGLRLPATLVFDHPSAGSLAAFLRTELLGVRSTAAHDIADADADTGADSDPVVIVGMACRFPGGVSSPDEFWELLAAGGDAISGLPTDRGWDVEGLYDPDPDQLGKTYSVEGGFIDDATRFDADFFGISPREALAMDPQQRLLLETSWEALERAGIDPDSLRESRTGVFAGLSDSGYGARLWDDEAAVGGYRATGSAASVASGRVAYALGLQGPAMSVDTACSSSLVALHLATQSLRQGECSMALVGGVMVMSTPAVFVEFSRLRGLAADGRCKPFAASADGTGWAEGVGVLVVERLSDARRRGHRVLAVVRGSAVNQDGASNGLTAPNGPAQQRVIRQALAAAGLRPGDVDVVEAHGTGTRLGDPIEAEALIAAYGEGRERPLLLGSVKSNVGHAQAAAGVAGVIKMVLSLRQGVVPATLHVDEPTWEVDWSAGAVELVRERRSWPEVERPRRAGVSSFGISGTNAHVILEEAPLVEEPVGVGESVLGVVPWVVSARSEAALRGQARRLAGLSDGRPVDVGYSLAVSRSVFGERAVVLGADREELLAGVRALAEGREASHVVRGQGAGVRRAVFVFPGQGSQWVGMAAGLLEESETFRDQIVACDEVLAPLTGWSLLDVLRGVDGSPGLERVDVVQPVLWAVMVGLGRLWRSLGVEPAAVVGHSQGEIAAAVVAGVLSLEDGARVVAERSRLLNVLSGRGGMVSVPLPVDAVRLLLVPWSGAVGVAAVNGPRSVTVSGDVAALEELLARCEADGIDARRVAVDYASHSAHVEDIQAELLDALAPVVMRKAEVPFYSTVTAGLLETGGLDAGYWYRNLRQTVELEETVRGLAEDGFDAFIEVSPHPVLVPPVQDTLDEALEDTGVVLGTLRRDEGGLGRFTTSLAQAHVQGIGVDWAEFFTNTGAQQVDLPTYSFQHKRYWLDISTSRDISGVGLSGTDHPLLGAVVTDPESGGVTLTGRLSLAEQPWLADHAIAGTTILPAAAFVELVVRAGDEVVECGEVEELTLHAPLVLPSSGGAQVQVRVGASDESGRRLVGVYARAESADVDGQPAHGWTRHASGTLAATASAPEDVEALTQWPPRDAVSLPSVSEVYDDFTGRGYAYGPVFQGLRAAWRRGDEVFAEVALPEGAASEAAEYGLHPALLDAALQAATFLSEQSEETDREPESAKMPFALSGVTLRAAGASVLRVRLRRTGEDTLTVHASDPTGAPVASIDSLAMRPVSDETLAVADHAVRDRLFTVEWSALLPDQTAQPQSWTLANPTEAVPAATDVVFALCPAGPDARSVTATVLAWIQDWLDDPTRESARLALVTQGAVPTGADDAPTRMEQAGVWGLVRSAAREHPGRFALVDLDADLPSDDETWTTLAAHLGTEPEMALREGRLLTPRLARAAAVPEARGLGDLAGRTVLITGGTGGLGSLVARHVAATGAGHVLLAGRRGPDAPGAAELVVELEQLGAQAAAVACDLSDREAVADLLNRIPADLPLAAVIHTAGAVDGGVVTSLTSGQLDAVFGAKADAAWHLHELTRDMDLSAFVLFSSLSGVTGAAGQANYAAANTALDALAAHRRAQGLPAVSLAWGLWEQSSGMIRHLGEAGLSRTSRVGALPLSSEQGLALLDAAVGMGEALVVPARLDLASMRAADDIPLVLRGLAGGGVRRPLSRATAAGAGAAQGDQGLATRLTGLSEADQYELLLDLVRTHLAAVLGHTRSTTLDAGRAFKDLGVDSLTAVELRNRLNTATGLRLPATLVFDHPSLSALTAYLRTELAGSESTVETQYNGVAARPMNDDDPIAIVGMACRFPGGASSPEEFWELLLADGDAISGLPTDRGWDVAGLYDPDPDRAGTTYSAQGGFIEDIAGFDAGFFGISPREALAMDPQQRLLLETSWEALERAGIDPASLRESGTGVFAGVGDGGYGVRVWDEGAEVGGYRATGSAASVVSGRVAYALGLQGPAVSIDTACSSSLVALHLAVQALRGGDCSLALAGGVMVMSTSAGFVEFSRLRGLAADGRCKAFGAGADGFGLAEGVGVLVVERLSDARRRGHRVLAVVRGSAVNQDGASNGLTAPNGPAQQRVIRQALAGAGLQPGDVDVVEAHGTGTRLGDPIEAEALIAAYGEGRERPLLLGSVKSNVGHAQAAAGVAGVIKMVLSLRQGVVPATLHVDEPTWEVDWSAGAVELVRERRSWPEVERPRRAGVSSFGISGTNAHVILEEAPLVEEPVVVGDSVLGVVPWVVSARSEAALRGQAQRLVAHEEAAVVDVGYSLATSRSLLDHRAVVLGSDRESLLAGVRALAEGRETAGVVRGHSGGVRRAVFVFPGQGSQWVGMAAGLLEESETFRDQIVACDEVLAPLTGWSLVDVLRGVDGSPGLERVDVVQPVLWAVMVGLGRLWRSLGVEPAAVVGHSQGEIAAAVVAGVLSLEDGARVVAERSRLLNVLSGRGGMVSVPLPVDAVRLLLVPWSGAVGVAAVNGPRSVTVSGDVAALEELLARCEADGIDARRVAVDYASHSAHVEDIQAELLDALAPVVMRKAEVPFYSTVTAGLLETGGLDAGYWYRNLRQTVELEETVRGLAEDGFDAFIEVSPHPVLVPPVQDTLEEALDDRGVVLGTLRRDEGGLGRFTTSLAQAHVQGIGVDWAEFFTNTGALRVDLPTYSFQHDRYWLDLPTSRDVSGAGLSSPNHPLLGAVVTDPESGGVTLTGRLSLTDQPWLADHTIAGTTILPGTAFVELVVRAGDEVDCGEVEELALHTPLVLSSAGGTQVQVQVGGPDEDGRRTVAVHARPESAAADGGPAHGWTRHASGTLTPTPTAPDTTHPLTPWPPENAIPVPVTDMYEDFAARGYAYGPAFQGIQAAWRRGDEVFAEVALPEHTVPEAAEYGLHPALLDAALQATGFLPETGPDADPDTAFDTPKLPFAWTGVTLRALGATRLHVHLRRAAEGGVVIRTTDPDGTPVASADAVTMRPVPDSVLSSGFTPATAHDLFTVEWSTPPTVTSPSFPSWALAENLTATPTTTPMTTPTTTDVVFALCPSGPDTRSVTTQVLDWIQAWTTAADRDATRLVLVTRGAVAEGPGDPVPSLEQAGVWGLVRSAAVEHPGRFALVDLDPDATAPDDETWTTLAGHLTTEPELALRDNRVLAPRLTRSAAPQIPPGSELRLTSDGSGSVAGLRCAPQAQPVRPLRPGEVRVAVRAAGLNFRDVLVALGVAGLGEAGMGGEGAGVVLEIGEDVPDLAPGDRVMGILGQAFGSTTVADHRLLVRVPSGWSFAEAASVPVVFATAYYGLVDLAGVKPGERVLVHAAAGGVGMAAVQLARHLGAEVFGTASPQKWEALTTLGLSAGHIASSRTLEFEPEFMTTTDNEGVDLVLNSLAGEFTDASLRLLSPGGRFLEMGKTDIRTPEQITVLRPEVTYRAFDLMDAGYERIGEILREVMALFERGVLRLPPIRAWDIRHAAEAFRFMSQARHIGKNVLTIPVPPSPQGTTLITGGTGEIGGLVARRMAAAGAEHVLLTSRRGMEAPGAVELVAELEALGARVTVSACDMGDRQQAAVLLEGIPADRPLTAVIHAAGVVDDGVLGSLTPEHVDSVFRPKVDAAWHLHELTREMDLSAFVLFSSLAGVTGAAGQANYAAANTALDALAAHRHAQGLPAISLAWGFWEQASGMTGHLGGSDLARMARGGVLPLSSEQGLNLLDTALALPIPLAAPARLDLSAIRASDDVPPILRALALSGTGRPQASRTPAVAKPTGDDTLAARLTALPDADRHGLLLDIVRTHLSVVLGHTDPATLDVDRAFKELGIDSLTAIELRNRLNTATGLRLPPTLVFDQPTATALARHLQQLLLPKATPDTVHTDLDRLENLLAELATDGGGTGAMEQIARRLRQMAAGLSGEGEPAPAEDLETANAEEMLALIRNEFGMPGNAEGIG